MIANPLQLVTARTQTRPALGTVAAMTAIVVAHSSVDMVSGSFSALLPTLRERFEFSSTTAGVLVAAIAVSTSLSQPLVGRLADRFGARRMVATGAFVCSALLSLLGVAPSLWLVFAIVVVGGLGSAGFHPSAVVLARRVLPNRGQLAVSLFSAGGMIGLAFGPLAVLLVAAHAGLGFTPVLMIPGVALGALLWRCLPDDSPTRATATASQTLQLLRGPVGRLAIAAALSGLAVTTFSAGLPIWLARADESGQATAIGATLALFQIGAAVGGLIIGFVVTRVAPARLAATSLTLAGPTLALVLSLRPGSLAFYATVVAAGFLANAATPLLIVAAQERAPGSVAAATGMVMGLASGTAGLAFIGIGAIIDATSLHLGLLIGFGAVIPAAAVARRSLADRTTTESPQVFIGMSCPCNACRCALDDASCESCGCSDGGQCHCSDDHVAGEAVASTEDDLELQPA